MATFPGAVEPQRDPLDDRAPMGDKWHDRLRWLVLISVGASSVSGGLAAMMFAPLIGDVAQDIGVNIGTASFAVLGVPAFVAAVAMAAAGFVIDRLGAFRAMMAGQLLLVASFAAMPLGGHNFHAVVVLRLLQGLGAACLAAVTMPVLARWFGRDEIGRAMGLQAIGMPIGLMLALNAAPFLARETGSWSVGVAIMAIAPAVAFLITATVAALSRNAPAAPRGMMAMPEVGATSFIRVPVFWVGLGLEALCFAVALAFTSLTPGYLAVTPPVGAGYGAQGAGALMFVHALAGAAGPPLGGLILDKFLGGRARILVSVGWLLSALLYTAVVFPVVAGDRTILISVLVAAGFANPFVNVTVMAFAAKAFPPQILGRVSGLWLSIGSLAGSGGVMLGSLALQATGNYKLAFLMIGAGSVIGLVLAQFLRSPPEAEGNAMPGPDLPSRI